MTHRGYELGQVDSDHPMSENFGDPSGNTNENYGHQGGAQAHWDDPWATMGEEAETMEEVGPPDEDDEPCYDEPCVTNLGEATELPEHAATTKPDARKPTLQQRREADTQHDLRQCGSHRVCRQCCQHAHANQMSVWLRDAPRCKKFPEELLEKIWGPLLDPRCFPPLLACSWALGSYIAVTWRWLFEGSGGALPAGVMVHF